MANSYEIEISCIRRLIGCYERIARSSSYSTTNELSRITNVARRCEVRADTIHTNQADKTFKPGCRPVAQKVGRTLSARRTLSLSSRSSAPRTMRSTTEARWMRPPVTLLRCRVVPVVQSDRRAFLGNEAGHRLCLAAQATTPPSCRTGNNAFG